ncbi:MAG: hypothetical protein M3Y91_06915 [Actinomycetota bacterium]|nr:hypothetical protein [Actinomycetota bacterium]
MATVWTLAGLLSSSQVGALVDTVGNPIAGQTVTLVGADGHTPAACWTDQTMTTAAPNVFPVGHAGQFQIWVTPGVYQPVLNGIPLELVSVAPNPADPTLQSAVALDSTTGDIAPVGSAASAGAVNASARADHVHVGAQLGAAQTFTKDQTFGGHVLSAGTTPTVVNGAALGAGPPAASVAAGSTDTRGQVGLGTGTTPATGAAASVTFAAPFATPPTVILGRGSPTTPAAQPYVVSTATTSFVIGFAVAPAASQPAGTYLVAYVVVG